MRSPRFIAYLFMIITWVSAGNAYSQTSENYNTLIQMAFTNLYEYNFAKAEATFKTIEKQYPNEPMTQVLGMNLVWWQIISGSKTVHKSTLKLQIPAVQDTQNLTDSSIYVYLLGASIKSRLDFHQRNFFSAGESLKKSVKYIEQSFGREKDFEPYYLTTGLYHYLSAYIYEKPLYLMLRLYIKKGNRSLGKTYLVKSSASPNIIQSTEAIYFLMLISGQIENNWTKAEEYATILTKRYPLNLWYQYLKFKCMINQNKQRESTAYYHHLTLQAQLNSEITAEQKTFFLKRAMSDLEAFKKK